MRNEFVNNKDEQFHQNKNEHKELIYSNDFKLLVQENPNLIKNAIALMDSIIASKVESAKVDGVKVSLVVDFPDDPDFNAIANKRPVFSVEFKDQSFFVKRVENIDDQAHLQGGVQELRDTVEAEFLVKDIPGVRVVNYEAGFSAKNYNYFVAKLEVGEKVNLSDYMLEMKFSEGFNDNNEEYQYLTQTASKVKNALKGFFDVSDDGLSLQNAFYFPKTKEIVLFDLNKLKQ